MDYPLHIFSTTLFPLFLYHPPSKNLTLDKLNSDCLHALPVQLDIVKRGKEHIHADWSHFKFIISNHNWALYSSASQLHFPNQLTFPSHKWPLYFFFFPILKLPALPRHHHTQPMGLAFLFQSEKNFHGISLHIISFKGVKTLFSEHSKIIRSS